MKLNKEEIEALEQLVITEIEFFEKEEPHSEELIFYSNLQDKLNYIKEDHGDLIPTYLRYRNINDNIGILWSG